jgi:hypothetical protein
MKDCKEKSHHKQEWNKGANNQPKIERENKVLAIFRNRSKDSPNQGRNQQTQPISPQK